MHPWVQTAEEWHMIHLLALENKISKVTLQEKHEYHLFWVLLHLGQW